ncbi:MAG: helix-turn-helix domain-containing protein [Gammaproteobacteria bacterium]|nr:helix-turn-helix domain-containing protein [Gammaproteobacteria bacterium]
MDILSPHITPDDLKQARQRARLTLDQAADLAGVCRRTYRRQELGQSRIHPAIYRLFMSRCGWLPDPAWSGWFIGQGKLWTPTNWGIEPGELVSLPYLYAMIAELKRRDGQQKSPEPFARPELFNVVPFTR